MRSSVASFPVTLSQHNRQGLNLRNEPRAQLSPTNQGGGRQTWSWRACASRSPSQRTRQLLSSARHLSNYPSSIEGRERAEAASSYTSSSSLTASSAILIPSLRLKREYYFASVAFVRTFARERSCQSESTAVWSFHLYEKGEKAPPNVTMPGDAWRVRVTELRLG